MRYMDRKGNEITSDEYATMLAEDYHKIVARSYDLPNDQMVSTVWLGLEHPGGVFETMVFGGEYDQEMVRSQTETEALIVHLQLVTRLRGLEPIENIVKELEDSNGSQ